ncbi:sensor histidine kinase [Gorillibacterium sp. sgz500922]|uniref:sensor histidine kinase n=1 Tax=Gorillibacterium sp. sgz500922 TaxID=3446694 RepID=UPI003F672E87
MFAILTSVPLITVGLISYQKSYSTISEHSKASAILVVDQLARDIDNRIQDTSRLLELNQNPSVLQFLSKPTQSFPDAKQILQTIGLYREIYKYDHVWNILMVNLYGRGISERKGVFSLNQNPLNNPHFQKLMQNPDQLLVVPPRDTLEMDRLDGFTYEQGSIVSIMAAIKRPITHEVIGFMVIDLNDDFISQSTTAFKLGKSGYFYVADTGGQPIVGPASGAYAATVLPEEMDSRLALDHDHFIQTQAGKPLFIIFTTSKMTGWKIIGAAPLQEIVSEVQKIRWLIILTVGLSIAFIVALYFFITIRLTRPLKILKNKMRQAAGGNLATKFRPHGTDEVADLGRSFNTMIEQIKRLIDKTVEEEKQIQKAELKILQAQINPHFLYNTLDSIIWMAEAGKNAEVIDLVAAISRFFRISLSKGHDWISIRDELEHIRSYLTIQQVRYRDILDFTIEEDPSILPYTILKMTLQPIVENALYHGIKNKRGKGMIRITARSGPGKTVVIRVEDNGIGMKVETLKKLRNALDQTQAPQEPGNTKSGYGLLNVQQRISLFYGQDYKIRIDSKAGEGTTVCVEIPALFRGNSYEESLSG